MAIGAAVLGVCMQLAAAAPGSVVSTLHTTQFTLAWTHSIEKVRWEEDYEVVLNGTGHTILHASAARVKGSAAGMEPPADAHFINGWYEYQPVQQYVNQLRLTRSEFTADYEICTQGQCSPMGDFLRSDNGLTYLWACQAPAVNPSRVREQ